VHPGGTVQIVYLQAGIVGQGNQAGMLTGCQSFLNSIIFEGISVFFNLHQTWIVLQ
jgi:hypothetical protein